MTVDEFIVVHMLERDVRQTEIEGVTWYVLEDIADVFSDINVIDLLKDGTLDHDEFCVMYVKDKGIMMMKESALYLMCLLSDDPKSSEFKNWVYGEVMPSIFEKGYYIAPKD